jgi:uncharacterized protein (TIGR02588 family)
VSGAVSRKPEQQEEPGKRLLEGIAGIVGAVIALATLSVIVWDGLRGGAAPPLVEIEALGIVEQQNGYLLEIIAHNAGDRTAAGLGVEGTLSRDGEIVETATTTFDYVPSRSQRRGGLFFSIDPREYQAELRATGYIEP